MSREQCAGRGCRHSRSAHDDQGRCAWCAGSGRCRGWALTRPHLWRDHVVDVWFWWHRSWELELENATSLYATEVAEYREGHPEPTLKAVLMSEAAPQGDTASRRSAT